MRIAVGADHRGYALKALLIGRLAQDGHDVIDLGTFDPAQPSDYPDLAASVARMIRRGRADRGLLLCGSGVGASVAANKIPGIRAGMCHDTFSARQGVEDDDANVLAIGTGVVGLELAWEVTRAWVGARFVGAERHVRRLKKVAALEREFGRPRTGVAGAPASTRRRKRPAKRSLWG